MPHTRDDSVADPEPTDVAANGSHDTQIAVPHLPWIEWSAGNMLGAFVVAAIGADFERTDLCLHPDLIGSQL
jgi:hypothetical protein